MGKYFFAKLTHIQKGNEAENSKQKDLQKDVALNNGKKSQKTGYYGSDAQGHKKECWIKYLNDDEQDSQDHPNVPG
jgi:hypothetical protein